MRCLKSLMKMIKKDNFSTIFLFIKLYLSVILFFTFYRLALFVINFNHLGDSSVIEVFKAFVMGLRFDLVISGYVLFFPFLIISILSFFKLNKAIKYIFLPIIFTVFSVTFMVCAGDIPYFSQFFQRFSIAAFKWMDTPGFVIQMIIQEPRYWLYILLFFLSNIGFYLIIKRLFNNKEYYIPASNIYAKIIATLLVAGIMFVGIRGRIEKKSPIRVGTAYFSNNAFLNMLGLNPNFTLIRSYLDSKSAKNSSIELMDNEQAVKNLKAYLNISETAGINPIARKVNYNTDSTKKHNIILVLMEGMSAGKLSRHGNPDNLTPFFDSIANEGHYFENCYSGGIHTFNGIFTTLFSFPTIYNQHPMKETTMKQYPGIGVTLKNAGYSTIYFTTHDGQFDNVEGFLKQNMFEKIVEKKSYPQEEVMTALGVPDDYLFEFSIPKLNELHKKGKPFLSVFMTASDHGPYFIPEYFTPKHKNVKKGVVEYADYSLRKFIDLAKQEEWFENTIFVFVADHGAPMNTTYDISLDYVHVPLLFYAPEIIKEPKVFNKYAGQIDIFPSIMGLVKIPYTNGTMGIDLFNEHKPYSFFNGDDKYGVINDNWLLIAKQNQPIGLHKYKSADRNNYANEFPDTVAAMKTYAETYLQSFQYLKDNYDLSK